MATLLLRLAAPLQSWGDESKFETRRTRREPTKSGVVGMLAAALGKRRDEDAFLQKLNKLRFGVRVDREGQLVIDYHTAKNREIKNASFVTWRHYLSDAVFLAGLESKDEELLKKIQEALSHPAFPLFLGRRSCPPSLPLCLGIRQLDLPDALELEPRLVATPKKNTARVMLDAPFGEVVTSIQRDIPLSFNPVQRKYGHRTVKSFSIRIKTDDCLIDETNHDPFQELE